MLKFFRRIRKKLINTGNLKKYLIYAIGEIILVVIGILIALQVNTWNDNRKSNIQEQELANKLYGELLDYQNYCNNFLGRSSEEINFSEFILKDWRTLNLEQVKKYRADELSPFFKNFNIKSVFSGFQYYYDPKFPYYRTAANDGNISIIKDKDFVNRLDFIYTVGSQRMDSFYDGAGDAGEEMNKHITQNYSDLFIVSKPDILGDWDDPTYTLFFDRIKEDGTLKSLLEDKYSLLKLKKFTVEKQILPSIKRAIQHFEESKYFEQVKKTKN